MLWANWRSHQVQSLLSMLSMKPSEHLSGWQPIDTKGDDMLLSVYYNEIVYLITQITSKIMILNKNDSSSNTRNKAYMQLDIGKMF